MVNIFGFFFYFIFLFSFSVFGIFLYHHIGKSNKHLLFHSWEEAKKKQISLEKKYGLHKNRFFFVFKSIGYKVFQCLNKLCIFGYYIMAKMEN
jgi:hypothetical protein